MKPNYDLFTKLLEQCGCRAADVAKGTGLNPAVFSDWKRGKSYPKQDKIKLIADYLCVSWEDFYSEGEKPHYYYDEKTREIAEMLRTDSHYRMLFDAARGSKPEDLMMAAELLNRFKETNPD